MLLVINITVLFNQENTKNLVGRACTEIMWLRLGTKCRAFVTKVMKKTGSTKSETFPEELRKH